MEEKPSEKPKELPKQFIQKPKSFNPFDQRGKAKPPAPPPMRPPRRPTPKGR